MNYKLSADDLNEHLLTQLTLLRKACNDYDSGFDISAIQMSTILRILLKDSLFENWIFWNQ